MRKKRFFLLTITSLCLWHLSVQAQQSAILIFDFNTGKFDPSSVTAMNKLKAGDHYQVKITHLNPNLYTVSVNKSDTVTSPALTVPSFGGFSASDLSTLVSSINTGGISSTQYMTYSTTVKPKALPQLLSDFKSKGIKPPVSSKEKTKTITVVNPVIDDIKGWMKDYRDVLMAQATQLNTVARNTDQLISRYNLLVVKSQIKNRNRTNDEFFRLNGLSLNDLNDQFSNLRTMIANTDQAVIDASNTYQNHIWPHLELISKTKPLKLADTALNGTYKTFLATLKAAKDSLSAAKCSKYMIAIAGVENSASRIYLSADQQFSKDQTTVTLSVTPRPGTIGLLPEGTTWTFPLRVRSFWAVSSGIFVSTLYDHAYSTLKTPKPNDTPPDTAYQIVSENPAKIEFGVNSMIRYGEQIGQHYSYWLVGAGPGVTLSDKVRARLLVGGGFAFGRTSKAVIDIGYIAGYTDQLSVLYKNNLNPPTNPGTVTVSRLSQGLYLSFGYLFQ